MLQVVRLSKYYTNICSWFKTWHAVLHEDGIFLPKHVSVVLHCLYVFDIVHWIGLKNEYVDRK